MRLFDKALRTDSTAAADLQRVYEILHLLVDFMAAAMFVVGSALFFFPSTTYAATWLFLIGSIFFGLKPTLKLVREIHLLRLSRVTARQESDGKRSA